MNKKYICFGDFAFVEDENDKLVTRKYENNLGEVLEQENVLDLLNRIIIKDINDRSIISRKIKYLKYSSGKRAWSLYILIALYFFSSNGIIPFLFCLGIAKLVMNFKKLIIKKYTKKLNGLNYKINKSIKLLEEEKEKMLKIKNKKEELEYNQYIEIDDENKLYRLERNLHLAYLYKLKEDIIQRKIQEEDLDSYLDDLQINEDYLDEDDRKVILDYVEEKKKILTKEK